MDSTRSPSQPLPSAMEQKEGSLHFPSSRKRRRIDAFLVLASIFVAIGTLIWVLNIVSVIPGPWSSVFGAVFAGFAMIIALLDSSTRRG
jgi:hypothetical protein